MENKIGLFLRSAMGDPTVKQDPMLAMEKIVENGFKTTQFTDFETMAFGFNHVAAPWGGVVAIDEEKYFAKAAALGLEITALALDLSTKDARSPRQRQAYGKRQIDLAAEHGIPIVIGHGGEAIAEEDSVNVAARGRLVENLKAYRDYGAEKGVAVALEPGGPRWMVHGWKSLARVLWDVGAGLKINYDPANVVMGAEDPLEGLKALKDAVAHFHVKDAETFARNEAVEAFNREHDKLSGDFSLAAWLKAVNATRFYRETPHGEGMVDFKVAREILESAGYAGPFVIERESGPDRFGDAIRARERLL